MAAEGIDIVPNVMPTQLVRAYDTAGHRLFMSGTLADDAVRLLDRARRLSLRRIPRLVVRTGDPRPGGEGLAK